MGAYSPVAHVEALKNETIAEMAEKYGISIPQLCARCSYKLPDTVSDTATGMINADKYVITDVMKLDELQHGFERLTSKTDTAVKIVVKP